MHHMREDDRHESETLGEEDESLTSDIELIDRLEEPAIITSKSIDSYRYTCECIWSLESRGESRILETEESIIDTLVEGILLFALDTTTRCDDAIVTIECDPDRFLGSRIGEDISREITLCDDTFLAQIEFESFSDKSMHRGILFFEEEILSCPLE
jgi:hypothetical protein